VGPKKEKIEEGYVFFVGATAELVIASETDAEDGGEGLVAFKAFCEISDEGKQKL
jgi:mannose-6-phosphate isomerase